MPEVGRRESEVERKIEIIIVKSENLMVRLI
jgi:hypothetical protein